MPPKTTVQPAGSTASSGALRATTSDGVGATWVTVCGELDLATAPDLARTLGAAQAHALVVLDLNGVTFIDAAGIRLLADATARARNAGHRIVLARPSQIVTKALLDAGADGLIDRFDAVSVKPERVTDEQLMAQVADGDTVAFGQLYDRFAPRAHRVAGAMCRNASTAEDAVQEAFLAIWKGRATYQAHRGGVGGWLLTIVHRKAIDIARGRKALDRPRAAPEALDVHPDACDVAGDVIARDDHAIVRDLLSQLPGEQLQVISLAFFGELSHTEIARRLDLPVGTVKSRIRLGLTKLRPAALR